MSMKDGNRLKRWKIMWLWSSRTEQWCELGGSRSIWPEGKKNLDHFD